MALESESQGEIEKLNIPIVFSGVGKINAAVAMVEGILKFKPDLVLNLGSAGSSFFKTGQVIQVVQARQKDMDVSPLGFPLGVTPMEEDGGDIDLIDFQTKYAKGRCGTGDTFETQKPKLDCDLVDMELYAIAKVCKRYKIPLLSLKYITDGADGNSHVDWSVNLLNGAIALRNAYQLAIGEKM